MKGVRTLWIVALLAALMVSFGCGSTPPPESAEKAPEAAPAPTTPPAEEPAAEAPAEEPSPEEVAKLEPPVTKEPAPKVVPKAPAGNPIVVMETSKGTIRIELDAGPKRVGSRQQVPPSGHTPGVDRFGRPDLLAQPRLVGDDYPSVVGEARPRRAHVQPLIHESF